MLISSLLLLVAGVSEGRRDLPAEATAEGEPGWSDPASWWNGGPEGPTEGAQCPAEGAGGDHVGPEGLLQHQESGAGEMWGRAEEDAVRGTFSVTLGVWKVKNFWSTRFIQQVWSGENWRNWCRLEVSSSKKTPPVYIEFSSSENHWWAKQYSSLCSSFTLTL